MSMNSTDSMTLTQKHCVPCEGGTSPLTITEEDKYLSAVTDWEIHRDKEPHFLRRQFTLKNFREAMKFVNQIAEIAEAEAHHPDLHLFYNKLVVELHTHAIHGLSENDFILAAKIDEIWNAGSF